jgi:single-strand DNA-binding protein
MINRVVLVGRLTKDPDLRFTPNGVAVATFSLAVNRTFSNQQGERETDFINCVIWRKQAENVANFLKKGSLAGVEGRIQTRNYDGQDGKRVYVTEVLAETVQFLEPRNASNQGGSFGMNQQNQGFNAGNNPFQDAPPSKPSFNDDPFGGTSKTIDITDDDLPF